MQTRPEYSDVRVTDGEGNLLRVIPNVDLMRAPETRSFVPEGRCRRTSKLRWATRELAAEHGHPYGCAACQGFHVSKRPRGTPVEWERKA